MCIIFSLPLLIQEISLKCMANITLSQILPLLNKKEYLLNVYVIDKNE